MILLIDDIAGMQVGSKNIKRFLCKYLQFDENDENYPFKRLLEEEIHN